MIRQKDRQRLMARIEAACQAGARLAPSCVLAGIDARTDQRWQAWYEDKSGVACTNSGRYDGLAHEAAVDAVAALRGSPPGQRDALRERLAHSPLDGRHVLALVDGAPVAAGKTAREGDVVGVFDVVTAGHARRRGLGAGACRRRAVKAGPA